MAIHHFLSIKDFEFAIGGFNDPKNIDLIKEIKPDNVFFKQTDIINKSMTSEYFCKQKLHTRILSEIHNFKRVILYINTPLFMEAAVEVYGNAVEYCGLIGTLVKSKPYSIKQKSVLIEPELRKGDRDSLIMFAKARGDKIWSTHIRDLIEKKPIDLFLSDHWRLQRKFGQTALFTKEAGLTFFSRKSRKEFDEQVEEKDLDFLALKSYYSYLVWLKENVTSAH